MGDLGKDSGDVWRGKRTEFALRHLQLNVLAHVCVCGWNKQTIGRLLAHPVTLLQ